ncbi:MAG: DUF7408 domain-containing protein [Anaerolineales bacterium]
MKAPHIGSQVFRWLFAMCILAGGMAGARSGFAAPTEQQNSGVVIAVRAGFDGYYKDGLWLPVRVTVENNGPDISGALEIDNPRGYTNNQTLFTRALELPTQSRREFFLHVAPEGPANTLKIVLRSEGKELQAINARVTALATGSLLYGVLAGSPSAFNQLLQVTPFNGASYVAQLDVADLPAQSFAWQALDVLVLSDVDTGALSAEQRAALASWVTGGGQLLVMGGPAWQKTAAGVQALLPFVPDGTQTLTDAAQLATFAGVSDVPAGEVIIATGSLAPDAVTLVEADGAPLVAARRLGFGQIVYFAADPAFAPLKGWSGLEALFRRVLAAPLDRPSWAYGMTNWGQAQTAVAALPNLQLPNPLLICGFLGFYLVIVGPLNYLALRLIKRRELAWFTIPVIVTLFSVTAYIIGYFVVGGQAILHQLSIVQVWPNAEQARVDQAVGVFSPRRTTYTVEFAPGFLARQMPNTGGPVPAALTVEQGDSTQLSGIRTDIASVQGFAAQGFVPAPRFDSNLRIEVNGTVAQLIGEITNQSTLTLKDAVLLAPGGALRLGDFGPGQTQQISMLLTNVRASPAPNGTIAPSASGVGTPYGSTYYPGYYDTTIDDIVGNTAYYNDRESYRRYSLLSAAINTYTGYSSVGRGSGVYLAGWTEEAPASARILNAGFETENASVYLVALNSVFDFGGGAITVPPGLMTWTPLSTGVSGSTASPYDTTLYVNDSFTLRFNPVQTVNYSQVQDLTLSIFGSSYGGASGSTTVTPGVAVWDFSQEAWVELDVPAYGTHTVSEPERFVGPGGEIRARLSNAGPDSISLTSFEFVLTVEP